MNTYWTFRYQGSPLANLGPLEGRSPDALWAKMREIGWTRGALEREAPVFARIRPTRQGFNVTLYPTLGKARSAAKILKSIRPSA